MERMINPPSLLVLVAPVAPSKLVRTLLMRGKPLVPVPCFLLHLLSFAFLIKDGCDEFFLLQFAGVQSSGLFTPVTFEG